MNSEMIGKILLERYRIDQFLGRGGMAEVYKVWDMQRSTSLAMKLLLEDLAVDRVFLRRFKREADTLSQLQHPNIVRFYGLEQDGPFAFMLMDFIEGKTLKRAIFDQGQPFSIEQVYSYLNPISAALQYAHNQGLIHCDLKPGNVMINKHGEVMLSDFGISRFADAATATMVGMGTPAYMAPEQVKGLDPVPQTDIYSLGVLLYEMFTGGERPFTGEQATSTGTTSAKVRWEHVNLPPPSPRKLNPRLTPEIEQVILRCLEKDPRDRYQAPLELLNALAQANQGVIAPVKVQKPQINDVKPVIKQDSVTPLAPQTPEPVYQPQDPIKSAPSNRRRGGVWIGLAGIAILVLGIVFGARLSGSTGEPQQQYPKSASDQQSIDTPVQQQASTIPEICINNPDETICAVIEKGSTVKIGFAGPMAGDYSAFGIDISNAGLLAVEDANAVGGIDGFNFELLIEDTQGSGEGGASVANLYVSDPDVVAIAGHTFSGSTAAAIPIYNAARLPMLSASASRADLTSGNQDVFNRIPFTDDLQGLFAAEYMFNVLGITKLAVMHDGDAYGRGVALRVGEVFERLGGEVVVTKSITYGNTDYSATLVEIGSQNPEAIYFGGYYPEAAVISIDMARTGLEGVILFSDDGTYGYSFIELAGQNSEGVYAATGAPLLTSRVEEFNAYYESIYGDPPGAISTFTWHGYDVVDALIQTIKSVAILGGDGKLYIHRETLIDAVNNLKGYQGMTTVITCKKGECNASGPSFQVVQDGSWVIP